VSRYAREVASGYQRREARAAALKAIEGLANPTVEVGEVFAGMVSAMEAAEASGSDERWATLGEGAREAVENIATVRRGESDRLGMPLPWVSTVPLMPLLLRGSLGIIGGHTGHGKSSSARSIAKTVGEYGYGAIVYSLEMSPAQFAEGVLSSHSDVSIRDVRRHVTSQDADDDRRWQGIQDAAEQVEALPVWICRDSQLSPRDIVARTHASTRKMRRKGIEPGLVVIDYLQLLDVDGADDNRANALSNAVRSFKLMARALDLPVVLLSGTNNNVSKREDKAPLLSDLEGSGGIARHADWVAFPNRASLWESMADEHEASMIWIKNRFGPLGAARLYWSGPTTTFRDRADAFKLIR
jgi:replicative DNA helicase